MPPEEAGGQDAETDVRGVLPMVRQRRGQIVHGRWSVHEGDGPERRFPRRRGIDCHADAVRQRALVHCCQFHPEIVRMLPIEQRLAPIALAALQQQWVATIGDCRGVETQHRSRLKSAAEQIAARHQHRPIERSELVIAPRAALLVVLDEPKPVQHE